MPHYGIFGRTESGKSTLGKIICKGIRKRIDAGRGGEISQIVVVNPMLDKWPGADVQFESVEDASEYLRTNTGCAVFIEEIGIALSEPESRDIVRKWLTYYRHLGHSIYALGQRYVFLPPTLRDQIKAYFVFAVSDEDAKEISKQFGHKSLERANLQKNLHFMYATYSQVYEGKIDFKSGSFRLTPTSSKV